MPASYAIRNWNDAERSFRVVASTPQPIKRSEWNEQEKRLVDFWESLEGWDLERFKKNPLFLESHNTYSLDAAIGLVSDVRQTDDGGLELKVTLASAADNKRVTELEGRIKRGLIRGVSVGWEYGDRTDEQRGGKTVRVYRNNKLSEVSLCLVPADEDALVEADTPDEETRRKERVSNAGRLLAAARATRTDADEDRFDVMSGVGRFERTAVGGIKVEARLTRTGILEYKRPDGTIRRELRLPKEVFNTDSLATLAGATVTDLEHHRGLLDLSTWKDATLGHTEAVRQDGDYVVADLVINDPKAVAQIENRQLHDISCGYRCKLRFEPGTYKGERYDCVQYDIRYNHVAVLPKGIGRAGKDVALRLDTKQAECVELDAGEGTSTMAEKILIKLDGKDLEYGSKEHISHLENAHLTDMQKWETEKKDLVTRCDKAEGGKAAAEKKTAELEEEKKGEATRFKDQMKRKFKRAMTAIRLMMEDDEEEEKTDARFDALIDKSDREIMLEVLRADARWKDDKFEDADGKPRSDEYIEAIFDSLVKSGVKRTDGIDDVVRTVEKVKRLDRADDKDELAEARNKMNQTARDAWKQPLHG